MYLATKGLFTWSGGPRSRGVGFFCFHALGDTKQKKSTPLDWGPPLHVNRVLDWKNNSSARASRFFEHFFAVTALHVFLRTWTQAKDFLFFFLNFDTIVFSTKTAYIWRTEQDVTSAIKFEARSYGSHSRCRRRCLSFLKVFSIGLLQAFEPGYPDGNSPNWNSYISLSN